MDTLRQTEIWFRFLCKTLRYFEATKAGSDILLERLKGDGVSPTKSLIYISGIIRNAYYLKRHLERGGVACDRRLSPVIALRIALVFPGSVY